MHIYYNKSHSSSNPLQQNSNDITLMANEGIQMFLLSNKQEVSARMGVLWISHILSRNYLCKVCIEKAI